MTCRDCLHYLSSEKANGPRPGLLGYGYCVAASGELKARLFSDKSACWLTPVKFQEKKA